MLMDRHGTSRVLFRNTRNGVKGFPHRNLHQIKLPLPTQYQTAIKVSGIMGAKKSVEARARHAVSGADLPELKAKTPPVELRPARRVAAGLPAGQPQRKSAGDLRQGRHRAAAGADAARA